MTRERKKQEKPRKSKLEGKLSEILDQLSLGVTITKVAKHFGCSRQNMYMFLEKKGISDPRNIPETFFISDDEDQLSSEEEKITGLEACMILNKRYKDMPKEVRETHSDEYLKRTGFKKEDENPLVNENQLLLFEKA